MSLNLNASPEDLKVFLEEAEELLQAVEEDLIRLEKEDETEADGLINEIFRAAHTLKGSSATIGHQRMAELTHAMENVLDLLRKDELELTSQTIDVLLECLDLLRVMKDDIARDEDSGASHGPLLEKLKAIAAEAGRSASMSVPGPAASAPTGSAAGLSQSERARANEALARGERVRTARITFSDDCPMPAVRAFQAVVAIEQFGEVIGSLPPLDEIEREQVQGAVEITFAGQAADDEVQAALSAIGDVAAVSLRAVDQAALAQLTASAGATPAQAAPAAGSAAGETAGTDAARTGGAGGSGDGGAKATPTRSLAGHTVRVDVGLLDNLMNLVGELVIDRTRLAQIIAQFESKAGANDLTQELSRTSVHIGRVSADLQEEIMKARMLPVENLFKKFPRMVRDLALKAGKEIDFTMSGQETELDRSMIEEISDPLMHLLRNAVDHGIESPADRAAVGKPRVGQVTLSAAHEESHIIITVRDDGKGIDPEKIKAAAVRKGLVSADAARRMSDREAINLIFAPGFSTAERVSEVSGRGVGMDVVRTNIERLSGSIEIETAVGVGTTFRLKLPLTLAIIKALLVNVGANIYCLPLSSVTETLHTHRSQVSTVKTREVIINRGQVLPLVRLRRLFGEPEAEKQEYIYIVVVLFDGEQVGLVVDSLIGEQEVVIKSLTKYIGDVQGLSGATILGDGRVGLIVDVPSLVKTAAAAAAN